MHHDADNQSSGTQTDLSAKPRDPTWLSFLERCGFDDPIHGNGGRPPAALLLLNNATLNEHRQVAKLRSIIVSNEEACEAHRMGLLSYEGLIDVVTNNYKG